jgi:hypothetical protein
MVGKYEVPTPNRKHNPAKAKYNPTPKAAKPGTK